MKTNTKIEIGLLAFVTLLSLILQIYMRQAVGREAINIEEYTGVMKTSTHNIPAFHSIESEVDVNVEYLEGEPKVVIYADESQLGQYKVSVADNGVLELTFKGTQDRVKGEKRENDRQLRSLKVYNNQPLKTVSVWGNGGIDFGNFSQNQYLKLHSSGNSSMMGKINLDSIFVSARDNSYLELTGDSQFFKARINGNAQLELKEYTTTELELEGRDNAHGRIGVQDVLDAEARGNSNFTIYGNPSKSRSNSSDNAHIRFVDKDIEE